MAGRYSAQTLITLCKRLTHLHLIRLSVEISPWVGVDGDGTTSHLIKGSAAVHTLGWPGCALVLARPEGCTGSDVMRAQRRVLVVAGGLGSGELREVP